MDRLGVFYTVGFFIIMAAFLAFVTVALTFFGFTSQRFAEKAGVEKIHNIDESIQESFRDIFSLKSGITVKKLGDTVIFIENLPNSKDADFKNNVTKFKNFIEGNYSVFFNTTDIENKMSLLIKPHNLIFTHPTYGGNVAQVYYTINNFDGFSLVFDFDEFVHICTGAGVSNDPYLNVQASGAGGSCTQNGKTNVEVLDAGNVRLAAADLDLNNKLLTITADSSLSMTLYVDNLDKGDETIMVTTQNGVLNFDYNEFKFVKNGTIRIL